MKRIIYLISLIFFISCQQNANEVDDRTKSYETIFSNLEKKSKNKAGFWNKPLYGPIMFIDPKTREFIANENDSINSFKKLSTIYVDSLPKSINIANTTINWNGKR